VRPTAQPEVVTMGAALPAASSASYPTTREKMSYFRIGPDSSVHTARLGRPHMSHRTVGYRGGPRTGLPPEPACLRPGWRQSESTPEVLADFALTVEMLRCLDPLTEFPHQLLEVRKQDGYSRLMSAQAAEQRNELRVGL